MKKELLETRRSKTINERNTKPSLDVESLNRHQVMAIEMISSVVVMARVNVVLILNMSTGYQAETNTCVSRLI